MDSAAFIAYGSLAAISMVVTVIALFLTKSAAMVSRSSIAAPSAATLNHIRVRPWLLFRAPPEGASGPRLVNDLTPNACNVHIACSELEDHLSQEGSVRASKNCPPLSVRVVSFPARLSKKILPENGSIPPVRGVLSHSGTIETLHQPQRCIYPAPLPHGTSTARQLVIN